jgi:prolyl-tRNA synthetase
MKQSQLFTKTLKEAPKDETSINARLLIRGGFVDKLMAGVYSILPLGWRVLKKIENIIREEMEVVGGQEIFMPALQPKENWEKTGRWKEYDAIYRLKADDKEYGLGPTHEEVLVPLLKNFVSSYRDLPLYVFQIQNKFRKELRAKAGLLRGREFLMKDLYSFHIDEKDLDNYYEIVKKSYFNIFGKCGIGDKTFLTFASGGTFSKYSHEFQTLTEAGEDIIYICDKCRVAANKEIIGDLKNSCPECKKQDLRQEKAVEVGNIFKLKTKFSEPFNLDVLDEKGDKKMVIMGCYGIGLQRLMGTIVEINNDEKGIIWPEAVAPFTAHLLVLPAKGEKAEKEIKDACEKIYNDLTKSGIEVLYDDRENISAGEKFAEADLIGIPYRIVVSEKTMEKGSAEIKRRNSDEAELVHFDKINSFLKIQDSKSKTQ